MEGKTTKKKERKKRTQLSQFVQGHINAYVYNTAIALFILNICAQLETFLSVFIYWRPTGALKEKQATGLSSSLSCSDRALKTRISMKNAAIQKIAMEMALS